jgi:predicted GH43/DUF377 family glycosyl hydrolase
MIDIKKRGILLNKTHHEFENAGVLNPGVMQEGNTVHLFYRAVRKGNFSTIGYCELDGPVKVKKRHNKPLIVPQMDFEFHGVEDARIVKIEDLYYLTYTAYDGINARGALAISKDLIHFDKFGIIVPPITYVEFAFLLEASARINNKYYVNHKFYYTEGEDKENIMLWDKNVIFFPRRIKGKLHFLHRIRPGIQIVAVTNLEELTTDFWREYCLNLKKFIVMDPLYKHESRYIGGGCPPIETEHGWLLIYHGVEKVNNKHIYSACAALLDLDDPTKELARLPYFLFTPDQEWELKGYVNNVVFPTGTSIFGETLYIYYGAADEQIACASVCLPELLHELLRYTSANAK